MPALLRAVASGSGVENAVARAVAGVRSAVVAPADPAVVVIGGSWGRHPTVLAAVAREFANSPRHVPIEAAAVNDEPALTRGPRGRAAAVARR